MSSFQVGATSVSFLVVPEAFSERRGDVLRTWDGELYVTTAADYTTLNSLFSGPVSVRTCPGSAGATAYVDIGGGAGKGTLTLDNVAGSPFTAALVRLERGSAYPGGGRRCRATFQEAP